MSTKGVQEGRILSITASGAVASGSVQEVGTALIGVALNAAAASGDVYPLSVEGVHEVAAKSGETHSVGDRLYWDSSAATASKTYVAGAADACLGVCAEAMASASTTKVKLRGIGEGDLDARVVASHASDGVIGSIPVLLEVTVPAAAGTTALVSTHKVRVIQITAVKTHEAGLAGGTLTVKNGSNAISNAIVWDDTTLDKATANAGSLDDAYWEIAAGGTINVVTSQAQSRGRVCLLCVRVA